MIVPRTLVREYAKQLVSNAVESEVADRVYVGRPNPVMFSELPFVLIMPITETVVKQGGSEYLPLDFDRIMSLSIFIAVDRPTDPSESLLVEDRLDVIGRKIEKAFNNDRRFQKLLSSWSGDICGDDGILSGSTIRSVEVDLESEAESTIAVMQLNYELLYEDRTTSEKRENLFESYLWELRRVGWDDDTVDPVIIAAEGDLT